METSHSDVEIQTERRHRNLWTLLIAIEAGVCGDLAGVHSGFHVFEFETTSHGILALFWWSVFFLGYGICAVGLTLALAAAYYAVFK